MSVSNWGEEPSMCNSNKLHMAGSSSRLGSNICGYFFALGSSYVEYAPFDFVILHFFFK